MSSNSNRPLPFLREADTASKRPTDDFLDSLLSVRSVAETKQLYSQWAANYEKDIVDMGYNGGPIAAHSFLQLDRPKDITILDIGAGTGIIGQILHANGYTAVDALDGNEQMLAILKGKNCYRKEIHSLVGPDIVLPVPERSYDVVIAAGVFCPGHMEIRSLEQMVKAVKKGGLICWSMGDHSAYADRDEQYRDGHFDRYIGQLVEAGIWRPLAGYPKTVPNYIHGVSGLFYALEVL